jgi:hypothetical protein
LKTEALADIHEISMVGIMQQNLWVLQRHQEDRARQRTIREPHFQESEPSALPAHSFPEVSLQQDEPNPTRISEERTRLVLVAHPCDRSNLEGSDRRSAGRRTDGSNKSLHKGRVVIHDEEVWTAVPRRFQGEKSGHRHLR